MSFELSDGRLTFNGSERKSEALFLQNLVMTGNSVLPDVNAQSSDPITVEVAKDVTTETIERLCRSSDFILRHS